MDISASRDEWLTISFLLALVLLLLFLSPHVPFAWETAIGTMLLAVAALFHPAARQKLILFAFVLPFSPIVVLLANRGIAALTPQTIDPALLRMDHGWSSALYRWTLAHEACRLGLNAVYYGLPIFFAFVLVASPRRMNWARAWLIAALLAPLFYVAFPAVGPAHLGDPGAPRNCLPSVHLSWALLCVVYIAPRLRSVALVFALLTAVATLGTGEHYLIDLIAALPYTALVCWFESVIPWHKASQPELPLKCASHCEGDTAGQEPQ